jgi:DNA-binding GntR family transcriptional regulator
MQSGSALAAPERPNISADLVVGIRQMIFDGGLGAGERINEVHLAEGLGVSRTPLREALMSLVMEGAVEVVPRRGFFVRPLTVEELQALYPIRRLLDPEALRLSGLPSETTLSSLERLNERLGRARGAETRIRLDDEWHLSLVACCPNPVLIELIEQLIRRTRRYELAYLKEAEHTATACREHRRILAALRRGDMDGACERLRENLTSGEGPILKWLKERG